MIKTKQISEIYCQLPVAAQQEALDFLLFLLQRYGNTTQTDTLSTVPYEKEKQSIRNNPAFGMWADLQGSSRECLSDIRKKQWTHS